MVKVRIDPIDRDVKLLIDEFLSPAGRSKQFALAAKELLTEADETNKRVLGRIPKSQTYVDGVEGAALASVKPNGGVIVREYELVIDVLLYVSEQLRAISPVGHGPDKRPGHPGFYRASHVLFADGKEVNFNGPMTVGQILPASEYVFLSDAPYARRVEKRSTPYEFTAAKASKRFGRIARVAFGWKAPISGGFARGKRADRSTSRVPAIIVTIGR